MTDLMASVVIKPVGEMGFDIAVGSAQRLVPIARHFMFDMLSVLMYCREGTILRDRIASSELSCVISTRTSLSNTPVTTDLIIFCLNYFSFFFLSALSPVSSSPFSHLLYYLCPSLLVSYIMPSPTPPSH